MPVESIVIMSTYHKSPIVIGTMRNINCVTVVTRFRALLTNQLITKQPKHETHIQSIFSIYRIPRTEAIDRFGTRIPGWLSR